MKKRKLGIIGGSGLYKMEGFEKPKWKKVNTPWGKPSDLVLKAIIILSFCSVPEDKSDIRLLLYLFNLRVKIKKVYFNLTKTNGNL